MDKLIRKIWTWYRNLIIDNFVIQPSPSLIAGVFGMVVIAGVVLMIAEQGKWKEANQQKEYLRPACIKECIECHTMKQQLERSHNSRNPNIAPKGKYLFF